MPDHPLAEVFGYPIDNVSKEATRHRSNKLCPFGNISPNCTKTSVSDPLGVCSVFSGNNIAITCPIRFREENLVAADAARFFGFPDGEWTSFPEVRLKDKSGKSAGNIDLVVARYDKFGQIVDFGAIEIQAVYISGNIRTPFAVYMHEHAHSQSFDWKGKPNYPRPDYLSSSRKRLAPQLIFKSGILHEWGKKTAVVLDRSFYNTLPQLDQVDPVSAEIAWMIYDLKRNDAKQAYELKSDETVYTKFSVALEKITRSDAGDLEVFIDHLQSKFTKRFNNGIIASDSSIEDSVEEIE